MDFWAMVQALCGGVLIGIAASMLLALDGRIAGISGIVAGLMPPRRPDRRNIDGPLVAGAVLFGIGWGPAGLCPGPAVTSLASGEPAAALFVVAMLVGMAAAGLRSAGEARAGLTRRGWRKAAA